MSRDDPRTRLVYIFAVGFLVGSCLVALPCLTVIPDMLNELRAEVHATQYRLIVCEAGWRESIKERDVCDEEKQHSEELVHILREPRPAPRRVCFSVRDCAYDAIVGSVQGLLHFMFLPVHTAIRLNDWLTGV